MENTEVCDQGIDVSKYITPCKSLPLDSNFNSQNGGGCKLANNDCLGNKVEQLGQSPTSKHYPVANNLSENAFDVRYFVGKTATGGGYYPKLNSKIGGLPEINAYADCNKPVYTPKKFSKPVQLNTNQKGGAYSKIVNPLTGRKVSIFGKLGRKILKNYILFGGDGEASMSDAYLGEKSNFDPNMTNRKFGCSQPSWNSSCV